MAKQKKVEPAGTDPLDAHPGAHRRAAIVPYRWLMGITALLVVPWLVVAAVYVYGSREVPGTSTPMDPTGDAGAGPWGRLVLTPIIISPPQEYVPKNWGPLEATLWHLPVAAPQDAPAFLSAAGLAADDVARLMATARPHAASGGMVVEPDTEFVRTMHPDVRARLYISIAQSRLNGDQQTAYRFHGSSPDRWLGPIVSPRTRELVMPYIYRYGDFMYFADVELVRPLIEDPAELQRLAKALYRHATMVVSLKLDKDSDVGAIAEYWGRGGRRTDVRPLLESVAESGPGQVIDVSHLLPALARELLYRYPKLTVADYQKPLLANCLWTALNFFNITPDDRLLDVHVALDTLKKDYYVIQDEYQLGDVVAFSDRGGNIFHVAVYIADDLVFGKNGITPMAPWSILPIERIKGHYVEDSQDWQVTYHRKKGL